MTPKQLIASMIGVTLLAAALGWLALGGTGMPVLLAGLAAIAACPVLSLLLGWRMAGNAAAGNRMAAELRDKTAALIEESDKRRAIELALDRYVQRERMFSTAV